MEENPKRQEKLFWVRLKSFCYEWRVTVSILWVFFLIVLGLIGFAIIWWTTRYNYSGEVDAAMINSLVAIGVTVPMTLLTAAGTIAVTVFYNKQTQQVAIKTQRMQIRDKILEKRMEIYPQILEAVSDINFFMITDIVKDVEGKALLIDAENKLEKLTTSRDRIFISKRVNRHILHIMSCFMLYKNLYSGGKDPDNSSKLVDKLDKFNKSLEAQIAKELDLTIYDKDIESLLIDTEE